MVRRRSTLACIFTAILTLNAVVSEQVESRDILGLHRSQSASHGEEDISSLKSTGDKIYLSCYCMSTTSCSSGVQNCSHQDDPCMVAKVGGVIRAAGCTSPVTCRLSAYTCCGTNMCNVLPDRETTTISTATHQHVGNPKGSRPNETAEGDMDTISTEVIVTDANAKRNALSTAQTRYETTSSGLTSVKCSQMILVVLLLAITLNLYGRM